MQLLRCVGAFCLQRACDSNMYIKNVCVGGFFCTCWKFFQLILPELETQLVRMCIRIIHLTPFPAALRSFEHAGDVKRACWVTD